MSGITLFILLLLLSALIACGIIYNALIRKRNYCRNAFAQIDVQLTRRYDLIPNLVNVAKEYMRHESDVLTRVTEARNIAKVNLDKTRMSIGEIGVMNALSNSEMALNGALGGLRATVEGYPELKANEQMMRLSEELIHTENRVAFARQAYNDAVLFYNNQRETFPSNIFSAFFRFNPMSALELKFDAEMPKINL